MKKETIRCPECGSENIAEVLWGMPAFDEELEEKLADGSIVFGGCCISPADSDWHCNDCGCEFGDRLDAYERLKEMKRDKLKGVVYGAAVGDALGVPCEFMGRDSFQCEGLIELMIEYNVGVTVEETYEAKRIALDFFDEVS